MVTPEAPVKAVNRAQETNATMASPPVITSYSIHYTKLYDERIVAQCMDLTPRGIRTHLDLNKPIYARTAAYGHFGRAPEADGGFSWEKTDLIEALKKAV